MPTHQLSLNRPARRAACAIVAVIALLALNTTAEGQTSTLITSGAVGGISVDAQGLVQNATVDQIGKLRQLRADALRPIPGGLDATVPLRKISLRRLDEAMAKFVEEGKPLPDDMECLAGLQQIRYVFVYPDQKDIVLVGPGEPWKVDAKGALVGITSGRPVMLLDDLLVALRSAGPSSQTGISCSIDPQREGLAKLQTYLKTQRTIGDPEETMANIEKALGMQTITLKGVPATSHFARVMVAADYRMKRLGMNFEPAPVAGLPSYLQMIKGAGHSMGLMPRWWLTPVYEPLLRDADGLAWELRGAAVKTMTEDAMFAADGARKLTGRTSSLAQKWANLMTAKYPELSVADPVFGELRNCMELAVAAALIVRYDLPAKAGCSLPVLMDSSRVAIDQFPAPTQIESQASAVRKGKTWFVSASGGIEILAPNIISKTEQSDQLAPVRTKAASTDANWWWN